MLCQRDQMGGHWLGQYFLASPLTHTTGKARHSIPKPNGDKTLGSLSATGEFRLVNIQRWELAEAELAAGESGDHIEPGGTGGKMEQEQIGP